MDQSPKHRHGIVPRSDTLAKLVPLRARTDPVQREVPSSRKPLRNAVPNTRAPRSKNNHSYRQAAKDTVQSALELRPPITFEHLLRRDRRTPVHSRGNSTEDVTKQGLELVQQQTQALRKHADINVVQKLVDQNRRCEADLQQALQQVAEQGTRYTRQLDDTYYVLLERGEALRQIVRNLQGLVEESRILRVRFEDDAATMQQTIDRDVDSYQDFKEQEQTIRLLLSKLDKSRDRTTVLNERLDAARRRVEASEQRVFQAQKQRRQRWQIIWTLMAAAFVVMLGIWIARKNAELNARIAGSAITSTAIADVKPIPSEDAYLRDLFAGIS